MLLALIGLAMLSAGGVAYALLYNRVSSDSERARRFEQIRDRSGNAPAVDSGGGFVIFG
jgi:hypothetical protein